MLDLDLRLCILGTTSEPFGDPEKCFWGLFVPVRQGGRALALTGPQAIGAVFGVVLVHEVTADDGQMISHVWDRLMQRAPITTIAGTIGFATVTVAHLLNALDRHPRLDPYAGFGFAVISAIKAHTRRGSSMKSQAYLAADEHVIAERDGFHVCIRTPLHGGGCTWKPTSKAATDKVLAVLNARR